MDLEAKLTQLIAEAEALVPENGDMTDEQAADFDAKKAEIEATKKAISRRDALQRFKDELNQPAAPRVVTPEPAAVNDDEHYYTSQEVDPMLGFSCDAEFYESVLLAGLPGQPTDSRLVINAAPSSPHIATGATQGDGYMVPNDVRDRVWNAVMEEESMLSLVNPEPTSRNTVEFAADETTPWGSTGVQAYWGNEASQMTESHLDTEGRSIKLHKLYALVTASDELLSDSTLLTSRLNKKAPEAIRYKASDAIINGTGVGQPLGFMNNDSKIEVTRATASKVDDDDVAGMYARLLGNPDGACWLTHKSVLPQLMIMTIGDQPVWTPPQTGLRGAPGGFLLGLPIKFSQHCKALGTPGDIQLCQPKGYAAYRKAEGIKFATSMHLYFDYDVHAFRWTFRIGGEPLLNAAVSPANGTDTLSHFITLDT